MAENRDAARKGKAIELLVAATCILASDLKLNVSMNIVDDEGVDLVFHRRDDPTTLAVQVKGRLTSAKTIQQRHRFQQNVKAATFRPRPNLAMLFVVVDATDWTFPFTWFIPSENFLDAFEKPNGQGRYAFIASTAANSRDRWSRYKSDRAVLPAASILCLAGIAWFIRIQRAGAKSAVGPTMRRGGALLAAGGLLALTGCGQGSHRNRAHAQTDRLATPRPLVARVSLGTRPCGRCEAPQAGA